MNKFSLLICFVCSLFIFSNEDEHGVTPSGKKEQFIEKIPCAKQIENVNSVVYLLYDSASRKTRQQELILAFWKQNPYVRGDSTSVSIKFNYPEFSALFDEISKTPKDEILLQKLKNYFDDYPEKVVLLESQIKKAFGEKFWEAFQKKYLL